MLSRIVFCIFTVFSINSLAQAITTTKQYKNEALSLIKLLRSDASAEEIITKSKELTHLGVAISDRFAKKVPSCEEYIKATNSAEITMQDLSSEDIEKQFHSGAALPKTDNPNCYNAKDLVVHPATVIVLAKENKNLTPQIRQQMQHEIKEVLAHLSKVKKTLMTK